MPSHTRRGRVLLGGSALPHRKVLSFATLPGAQDEEPDPWLRRIHSRPRSSPYGCHRSNAAPSPSARTFAASVSPRICEGLPLAASLVHGHGGSNRRSSTTSAGSAPTSISSLGSPTRQEGSTTRDAWKPSSTSCSKPSGAWFECYLTSIPAHESRFCRDPCEANDPGLVVAARPQACGRRFRLPSVEWRRPNPRHVPGSIDLAIPSARSSTGPSRITSSASCSSTRSALRRVTATCAAAWSRPFTVISTAASSTTASPACAARVAIEHHRGWALPSTACHRSPGTVLLPRRRPRGAETSDRANAAWRRVRHARIWIRSLAARSMAPPEAPRGARSQPVQRPRRLSTVPSLSA